MTYQVVVGILLSVLGLLVCIFPKSFSGFLSTSKNILGRNFKEKLGESKGKIITIVWSIIISILSPIAIFTSK